MKSLHKDFPHYNWKQNKGYGTPHHRRQMSIHGFSPFHRLTFKVDLSNFEEEVAKEEIMQEEATAQI